MTLLLHVCCAPCLIYPAEVLSMKGIPFSGYFFNPNIHPFKEFKKRLDTAIAFCESRKIDLFIEPDYGLKSFLRNIVFRENQRCSLCYRNRLFKTAGYALSRSFDSFSSTLFYSVYQNHSLILKHAENISSELSIPLFYQDFRQGWQSGVDQSISLSLYRQNYCGCIFSEQERFDNRLKKKMKKGIEKNV